MKYLFICLSLVGGVLIFANFAPQKAEAPSVINEETSLAALLEELGDSPLPHVPDFTIPGVSAAAGEALMKEGIAMDPKGGKTGLQSRHFVCTSRHNLEREDPDLATPDPQTRLDYVNAKGLPFLQGTTLWGAVNRTSFYNDDYFKKYGDLVDKARNDIREAIQLCAVECAQGRKLDPWELESMLAYLWTLELKVSDLNLSVREKKQIENGALLKSKYLAGSPAHFLTPPENRQTGYPLKRMANPDNGAKVYKSSCLHCHENQRYSYFNLDYSKNSFEFLKKHLPKYTRYSTYQVVRYGTSPIPGKRAYMPHYPEEKLSNAQMEDLRAYFEQQAE